MAGARTVEEILARGGGEMFDIAIFGDEPFGNYNRIMLSAVLEGTTDPAAILLNPIPWYGEHAVRLRAGVRADRIFRYERTVTGSDRSKESYDKLIIATGSHPFIPPLDGLAMPDGGLKPGIFGFRTLGDCERIAAYVAGRRRVAVIGGGLLGLECARALVKFDVEVHIVHHALHLMNQQIDAAAGAILKSQIEKMGIQVHLGAEVRAIAGEERITGLLLGDEQTMDCEMAVFATGTRPNYEIARSCGLTVERAIVVDDHMLSVDDPNIYAVGECVQHEGRTYGLVGPVWEQAKVLADNITGHDPKAAYHGSRIATKLKVAGVELASMGAIEPESERDEVVQFSEPRRGTYKKVLVRDGHLLGAILLGDISKAAYLLHAFDSNTPLPEERLNLLFDIGAPAKQVTFEQMPMDTQVCNCNGVSKGAIVVCTQSAKRTPKAVMEATRAGMGCGSCKSLVTEIVEWAGLGQTYDDPSVHYYVPGVALTKAELIDQIRAQGLKSVSAVFRALAGGNEDPGSKPGLASLLNTIWANEYEDERDARFINDRVHANIQRDGTFSVIPQIPGGVTSPAQLRRIADVAEKYNVPMVKLTGGQRIDLLGIKKEDLPKVWQDLGMPSGYAYAKRYRTCKSCVGNEYCRFGLGDSTALAIKIEERFQGLESPAKVKLATAGCPRNCSEAMVKDLGAVAVEGGKWEIYVGGAAGSHVRKGNILCVVDNHEEVLTYMSRFIQYYRENAKYLERTYDFVQRFGIEKLRGIIVEDSDKIAATLDSAIAESIAAYRDPWLEAIAPTTVNQFSSVLTIT